jgi:acetyltransferase-like isoleucine patch superfamily enzyme
MQDVHQRIAKFFQSDEPYVEFFLDCTLEERIDYICQTLHPWLTETRLIINFCISKIAEIIPTSSVKIAIYRSLGVKIGKGVYLSPDVILDPHFPRLITIEDYCVLGWGSKIFTHEMSIQKYRIGKVSVRKGAIIGAFSIIRAGVTIGENAQTCMNSFVYKDVPANHSGKPATRYE